MGVVKNVRSHRTAEINLGLGASLGYEMRLYLLKPTETNKIDLLKTADIQ